MLKALLAPLFLSAAAVPTNHSIPKAIGSPTEYYHLALRAFREDRWDDGILMMEYFVNRFPKSDLADNAIYWIAEGYIQKNELGLARAELQRIIDLYPRSDRASRALAHLEKLENPADDSQQPKDPSP